MKHVAIRLNDAKYRRLRVTVAHRGITLQQAVESAIDRYLAEMRLAPPAAVPLADFRGFLRDTGVMDLMEQDRRDELERDRRHS